MSNRVLILMFLSITQNALYDAKIPKQLCLLKMTKKMQKHEKR